MTPFNRSKWSALTNNHELPVHRLIAYMWVQHISWQMQHTRSIDQRLQNILEIKSLATKDMDMDMAGCCCFPLTRSIHLMIWLYASDILDLNCSSTRPPNMQSMQHWQVTMHIHQKFFSEWLASQKIERTQHSKVPHSNTFYFLQITTYTDPTPGPQAKQRDFGLEFRCRLFDLVQTNSLVLSSKIIVGSKKKHTMAFLPLSHGNTRAIPKSLCCLRSFVVIMPTRA